ncbi:NAD(P)-binding protein [Polychaeton citri CBS 116435]|uniref:NAD(P)-binding protein n=1 Tax=Polychaeton citri CBS 116435 TaxID=1314669 RepID=A0A9P4QBG7_9PEZI|nr:NAD(P)-binding protein [Polychaeton citri CBS 116435]
MVKITIAGGSGEVAREVIDALLAANKHDITVLSRSPRNDGITGLTWRKVDYDNKSDLVDALQGTHTVLSFIQLLSDPENKAQKNLIDAAIVANVKRFAPSGWGSAGTVDMPWWAGKDGVRKYLKEVNEKEKVRLILILGPLSCTYRDLIPQLLEYTLFQPGLFLDYLAFPYKTVKYVTPLKTMLDFQNRRAIVVNGQADKTVMTLTTVHDLATVVARAVDYSGEWPVVGGISGNKVTIPQILEIGHQVRGRPFVVDVVELKDLEDRKLNTSWSLQIRHPSFTAEQAEEALRTVLIGTLMSSVKGAWDVSDEFNQLLPEFKFTQIEEFLAKVWKEKL